MLPQLSHLHAKTVLALSSLHPVAVGTQQLPVPDLVFTIVAERQDVVHLKPQVVRQVDAAARADASLHSVEADSDFLGDLGPLIACPAALRRPLLVNLYRLQVFPQQRHVHGPVGLAVQVAADPNHQMYGDQHFK